MLVVLTFLTLVIYEPNEKTFDIDVYEYEENKRIEVICAEGVSSSECIEPRAEIKSEISLEDIQACADNDGFF